jgi:hypothetical protein
MTRALLRTLVLTVLASSGVPGILTACSSGTGGSGGESCPPLSTPECADAAAAPSWQNEVEPLIVTYCYQCHGDGGIEQSQQGFTTYAGVFMNRGEIALQVSSCMMPPSDASPPAAAMPDPSQRQTILAWVGCNAPDN